MAVHPCKCQTGSQITWYA